MKNIYRYFLVLSLVAMSCSPDAETLENEENQTLDLISSFESIASETADAESLQSFVISEDNEGNFSIRKSDAVVSQKRFEEIMETNTSDVVNLRLNGGATRSLTICCSSGRGVSRCVTCSGSNSKVCISNAVKNCNSSNQRDMIYNPKDNSFSIFGR